MKSFFEAWRKNFCLIKNNPLPMAGTIKNTPLPTIQNNFLPPLIKNNPGKHLTMKNWV